MKKIVGLLAVLFLLSGCDATYELEITSDELRETGVMMIPNDLIDSYYDSDIKLTYRDFFTMQKEKGLTAYFDDENYDVYVEEMQPDVEYYKITDYQANNQTGLSFYYPFSYENFYRSSIVNDCYNELSFQTNNNYVIMNTNDKCESFEYILS